MTFMSTEIRDGLDRALEFLNGIANELTKEYTSIGEGYGAVDQLILNVMPDLAFARSLVSMARSRANIGARIEEEQAKAEAVKKAATYDALYVASGLREAQASIALDGETQAITVLPPLERVEGKPLKSIDVACPTCKARPGKRCFAMTRRGPGSKPTTALAKTQHRTRVEAAKAEESLVFDSDPQVQALLDEWKEVVQNQPNN
jgi:hypothetical protein